MLGYGHNIDRPATPPIIKHQVEPRDSNSLNHAADANQPSLQANSPSTTPLNPPPPVIKPDANHTNIAPGPNRQEKEELVQKTGTDEEGTTSATHARRASIAEAVLAGAVTAASTAVSAASTVVTAARNLVARDDDRDDVDNNLADTEERDDQGLKFSQRHLSAALRRGGGTNHPTVGAGSVGPSTEPNTQGASITSHLPEILAAASASATGAQVAVNALPLLENSKQRSRPRGDDDAMEVVGTQKATDTLTEPQASPSAALSSTSVKDKNVASDKGPVRQDRDIQDVNSMPTSMGGTKDNRIENEKTTPGPAQKVTSTRPLNVMYVAGHGKDSTSHHAMGVDTPAVSKIMTSKAKHSGFGVDAPRLVDEPLDPRIHRTGSLHVDSQHEPVHPHDDGHHIHVPHHDHDPVAEGGSHGAPIQTSKDNSKVIHGNVHHQTGNTLPEARAAINKNPHEAHMSHHRGSASSGMNVDHAVIPTSALAGSGSSDNTNHNRPAGTYNSGINVDKPGSLDRKRSGMGVDHPATATHHMASAHGHFHPFGKRKTAAEDASSGAKHHPRGDHESLVDKVKHVFHRHDRHGTTKSHTTSSSSRSSTPPAVLPSELEGPGDDIDRAKGITRTDYYGDGQNEDVAAAPADVHRHQEFNQSNHHGRSSAKSLWNRLRGRHSPVDKGKQRV